MFVFLLNKVTCLCSGFSRFFFSLSLSLSFSAASSFLLRKFCISEINYVMNWNAKFWVLGFCWWCQGWLWGQYTFSHFTWLLPGEHTLVSVIRQSSKYRKSSYKNSRQWDSGVGMTVSLIIVVIIILSVFLERLSLWNMLSCAEQVQIQNTCIS